MNQHVVDFLLLERYVAQAVENSFVFAAGYFMLVLVLLTHQLFELVFFPMCQLLLKVSRLFLPRVSLAKLC